jgi:hypothetical protein
MRLLGFLLLLAGWLLLMSALVLLPSPGARGGFACAGVAVQLLGLGLAFRSHLGMEGERR